jgi:hypothetical protein
MVFTPTRGDAPARFGPGVPLIPDIGTGILAATRDSSAYRRNILNDREGKITSFHRGVQAMLDQAGGCS